MILRNNSYLKVYKCWRILPILKTPTIKWLAIFFKKYFNFQGFYIVYIIIWWFLGWKNFTPSKLGETGLQKMQNGKSFFGEKHGKIAHVLNFAPKIIPAYKNKTSNTDLKSIEKTLGYSQTLHSISCLNSNPIHGRDLAHALKT